MQLPEGHSFVMPYLILDNAEGFMEFVQTVFNAGIPALHKRNDGNSIIHAEARIGDSVVMFTNSTPEWKAQNANLFVYVENADMQYRLALNNGAKSLMEPSDQSYGRSCGVRDPFGNVWWITTPPVGS